LGNRLVQGKANEPWSDDLERRSCDEAEDRPDDLPTVRAKVAEETAHEAPVVGLPEGVFFVVDFRGHEGMGRQRRRRSSAFSTSAQPGPAASSATMTW
jgi:hypothetical protein